MTQSTILEILEMYVRKQHIIDHDDDDDGSEELTYKCVQKGKYITLRTLVVTIPYINCISFPECSFGKFLIATDNAGEEYVVMMDDVKMLSFSSL